MVYTQQPYENRSVGTIADLLLRSGRLTADQQVRLAQIAADQQVQRAQAAATGTLGRGQAWAGAFGNLGGLIGYASRPAAPAVTSLDPSQLPGRVLSPDMPASRPR